MAAHLTSDIYDRGRGSFVISFTINLSLRWVLFDLGNNCC